MEIESTTFGTITMGGKTYEHDVVVRLSSEVVKRKKKQSKKYYGTSHILSKDEAKFVLRERVRGADCWFGPNWRNSRLAAWRPDAARNQGHHCAFVRSLVIRSSTTLRPSLGLR
jgi:hypothetical protein